MKSDSLRMLLLSDFHAETLASTLANDASLPSVQATTAPARTWMSLLLDPEARAWTGKQDAALMRFSSTHVNEARVDERDTMFARIARRAGTSEYADYYARRPDLKDADDELRALPALLAPGATFFDETISAEAALSFRRITEFEPDEALVEFWADRISVATSLSSVLKDMALALGAVQAGCTRVEPEFVYSHRGRHDHHYGEEIDAASAWALVFLVEMDHARMGAAPRARVIAESAHQYLRAARTSLTMVAALERAGIEARSQHDAHYDVILPALAVSAGLGELGRNNILVADRFALAE